MNIYPKELHSLKALEQEKKRLKKQLKKLDEEEIFSMNGLMGKGGKQKDEDKSSGFDLSSILSFLPISNPYVATLLPIIQKRLFKTVENKLSFKKVKIDKVRKAEYVDEEALHHTVMYKVKKAAGSAVKELVFGYMKWKAVELAFKGAKYLIKQQKEKKRMAAI